MQVLKNFIESLSYQPVAIWKRGINHFFKSLKISANWASAAWRSSMIPAAMMSGGGRLALSSQLSFLSQSRAGGKRARQTGRPRGRLSGAKESTCRDFGGKSGLALGLRYGSRVVSSL